MTTKHTDQVGFRGRLDDTVGLNVDSGWATGTNANWSQNVDTVFRLRLEYQEDNNKNNTLAAQLEINFSGTWANITTNSGPIIATGSSQFADDTNTTDVLAIGAGTFVPGYGSYDGLTPSISLQNTHTEVEFCLSINSLVVNNNDTIQLRVAGLDAWTATPTITVIKAEAAPTISCQPATINFSGQQATISTGPISVPINYGTATFSGQIATVTAQAADVNIPCQYAVLILSGQPLSLVTGAVFVSCQFVTVSISGQQTSIMTGTISVACQSVTIALSGQSATISVGANNIPCQSVTLSLSGQQVALQLGSISVPCQTGVIRFYGQRAVIDVVGGAKTVACQYGTVNLSGQSSTVIVGEVIVAISNSNLLLSGQTLSIRRTPGAFKKSFPSDGFLHAQTPRIIYWNSSSNFNSYEYSYSSVSGTFSDWVNVGTSIAATLNDLNPAIVYYWQVRAVNGDGVTYADEGVAWSFTTADVPGAFNKSWPTNGLTNRPVTQAVYWSISYEATNYDYCITSISGTCNSWVNVGNSLYANPSLEQGTTYYWQIRANNSFGTTYAQGDELSYWAFQTIFPVVISCQAAELSVSAQALGIVPGEISVSVDYVTILFTALSVSISPTSLFYYGTVIISDSLAYAITITDYLYTDTTDTDTSNTIITIEDS